MQIVSTLEQGSDIFLCYSVQLQSQRLGYKTGNAAVARRGENSREFVTELLQELLDLNIY